VKERTMKIDGYNAGAVQGQTERADGVASRGTREAGASASEGTDQVRLSNDVQFVQAATAAAHQAPEVRQDVVERMRALLQAGQIGNDPERLADALIDSWIDTP
jgi:flagellar biosynthesis anti-sigma factor FlgM